MTNHLRVSIIWRHPCVTNHTPGLEGNSKLLPNHFYLALGAACSCSKGADEGSGLEDALGDMVDPCEDAPCRVEGHSDPTKHLQLVESKTVN